MNTIFGYPIKLTIEVDGQILDATSCLENRGYGVGIDLGRLSEMVDDPPPRPRPLCGCTRASTLHDDGSCDCLPAP